MGVVFPLGGIVEEPRYTPLFVVQTSRWKPRPDFWSRIGQ
jgi:hypothetical protein